MSSHDRWDAVIGWMHRDHAEWAFQTNRSSHDDPAVKTRLHEGKRK
jgi:hypothetical protein